MTRPLSALWNRISSAATQFRNGGRQRNTSRPKATRRNRRAFLESLEERRVLATVETAFPFTQVGSVNFVQTGGSAGSSTGRTWEYDFSANPSAPYFDNAIDFTWAPRNAGLGLSNNLNPSLVLPITASNLVAGSVSATSASWIVSNVPFDANGDNLPDTTLHSGRLTLTISETNSPLLTGAAIPSGVVNIGVALRVTDSFKARFIFEVAPTSGAGFTPADVYYTSNSSGTGGSRTSFGASGWYDNAPVIDANDFAAGTGNNGAADNFLLTRNGANTQASVNGNIVFSLPATSVTSLTFNGSNDNDTLTVDLAGGDPIPTAGVAFNGGAGSTDALSITGGSQGNVTYNYTNAHDGNIVMANFGTVTYTGLEPITNTGTAADVVFNLPAAASIVTLGDDGIAANGLSRLSSSPGTFETTNFANPTGSVTINRGNVADTIVVDSLPDFTVGLTIGSAAHPFADVQFHGAVSLAAGKNLTAYSAGDVTLTSAAALTMGAGGALSISADAEANGVGKYVQAAGSFVTVRADSSIRAADIDLQGMINSPSATLQLFPSTAMATIGVGAPGAFNLSDAEIDLISVGSNQRLVIGDGQSAGTFQIAATEAISSVPNLYLVSGGSIDVGTFNVTVTDELTFIPDQDTSGIGALTTAGGRLIASRLYINSGTGVAAYTDVNVITAFNRYSGDIFIAELNSTNIGYSFAGLETPAGGTVWLNGGTFFTTPSYGIGDAAVLHLNGATLDIGSNNETAAGLILDNGSSLLGTTAVFTSATTYDVSSGSISARLGGSVGLIKSTSDTVTLTGSNSYTGATTINGGVLSTNLLASGGLNSGLGAASNAASNLVLNGGTLRYTGPNVSTNRLFTLGAGGGTIESSGVGPVNFTNTGNVGHIGLGARTLSLTGTQAGTSTIAASIGNAPSLALDGTVALSNSLAASASNYNPQGMGYDPFANELLFLQQNTNTIYRTDLNGNIVGSRGIGNINYRGSESDIARFTVSIAADATNYYFSDYTANASGFDLYAIGKSSGGAVNISAETAAYGGTPIDVRNGLIYRTEPSTDYGYSDLNQIRVAAVGSPDAILVTHNLVSPNGIADFSIDTAGNSIWTLDYSASASIRQYDLTSGNLLNVYPLALDGLTAGLTYANGKLYYYNWNSGSGSTLSTYTVDAVVTSLVKSDDATWRLSGNNTYSGSTTINRGTLVVGSANALGANSIGTTVASGGSLDLNGFTIAEPLSLNGTGATGLGGALINTNSAGAAANGPVTLAFHSDVGGTGNFAINGVISAGPGGAWGLTKLGLNTVTLGGANTYVGETIVNEGTLLVNGSLAGPLIVQNTGTLGGTGTIANSVSIGNGSTLAPGTSPGILNVGNTNLASGSTFTVEIGGPTPGNLATNHDQLNVTGTVTIGENVTLNVLPFNGYVPNLTADFVIIKNDSDDEVVGTFQGLPQGTIISVNGVNRRITYVGGDGNDVVLRANVDPIADAGGPYAVGEGGSVTITAAASSDEDGTIVLYEWDLDNNGSYETTGISPVFSAAGIDGPAAARTVGLRVTDNLGAIATDTATITINNVAPQNVSAGGPYSIFEGGSLTLLASATDPAGAADPPSYTWDVNDDGVFGDATGANPALTPSQLAGFGIRDDGTWNVRVRVTDGDGGETTSLPVVLTVNNVAPALGVTLTETSISENGSTTLSGTITDPGTVDTFTLNLNWGDPLSPGNAPATFTLGTTVLTFAADGINWNPATRVFSLPHQYLDDNPSNSDSDPYTITVNVTDDDGGTLAEPATIDVTVNNVAPSVGLSLSSTTISENGSTTLTGTIADVGTLDTFTLNLNWGDTLSLPVTQTFTLGTTALSVAEDGINWNPATRVFSLPHQYLDDNPSASSSDPYTITVNVTDDDGSSLAELATIGLTVENLDPVAAAQTAATTEDASITPINVLADLTDVGTLDTHSAVAASGVVVGGGLYTLAANGSLTFDPNGEYEYLSVGQSVTRTISFSIVDDDGGLSTETVTITVNGVNDAPLANPDTNSTTEHAPVTTAVLGNDTDVDQADVKVLTTFRIASMTFNVNGTAIPVVTATVTDNDGAIVFDPGNDFDFLPAGATATVVINYTMRDGRSEPLPTEITASSSSTLTITINGENDAPIGNGDSFTTAEDTPLIIAAPGVLGNDTDVDFGTTLTVYSFMQPTHGGVAVNANGSFTYTPYANYNGPDSFRYRITDGTAQTSLITVTLMVTAVDDFDFGDAPASYGVASHSEGAGFIGGPANSGPLLGTRDFETANQASPNADGDDLNSTDDEDGVSFSSTTLVPRFNTTVTVNASAACKLDAWIDFNRNNVFDVGEKIANGLSVVAGSNTLVVPVPDNLTSGATFARFRLSSAGISLPTGLAADGEVEDYKLSIQALAINSAVVIDDPENPGSTNPDVLVITGTDGFYDAIAVRITKAATSTAPAIVTVYIAPYVAVGSFPLNSFGRIVVFGRGGLDAISIESPIDKPTTLYGDAGNDSISGGLGPDIIIGGDGIDTMTGNAGDDVFIGGLGNDTIAGGAGFDRFVEMVGSATVTNNTSKVGTSSDTFSQIEQIELTGTSASEAFTLTGVNLIVLLNAGDGADTLAYTGDGNVVLTNGLLTRTQGTATYNLDLTTIESLRLSGGQSNDSFNLTAWTKSLILSGGAGTDTVVATNDVNYTLSDTFLMRTGLLPIAQSTMENAMLTGGGSDNTFDISSWTKAATLTGNGGTDKLVVADNAASMTLTNVLLTRTGRGNATLNGIAVAELTGGAANNTINASTFSGQLKIDGAGGNDTITGGTGPSLLLGGLGNDVLLSGTASRTVLIGGQGLDRLTGNTNDDLLIAGQTLHDNNAAALAAILAEWASVANSYATRVANLTGPGDLLESTQVTHDNAVDVLLGGLGEDLFFAKQVATPGSPKDTYTDKLPGESIF